MSNIPTAVIRPEVFSTVMEMKIYNALPKPVVFVVGEELADPAAGTFTVEQVR